MAKSFLYSLTTNDGLVTDLSLGEILPEDLSNCPDLQALEALSGTSAIYYRSAANTWSAVTVSADLGFAAGTLGSALVANYQPLDADLTAIAALGSTGVLARTGSNTWSLRTLTGTANQITVSNGDGVSGNPTLSLTNGAPRVLLTGARTYYVRTDGDDANTGLTDSSGGAFLTIQAAINAASALDNGGFDVTIQVRDGTYTGSNTFKNIVGGGRIVIQGNSGTPANVIISTTSADCFTSTASGYFGTYHVKDLKVQTTTSGDCFDIRQGSILTLGNIVFHTCAESHFNVSHHAYVECQANYSITGNAAGSHVLLTAMGCMQIAGLTITLTGTPSFAIFADVESVSFLFIAGNTFSGSGTGTRYFIIANAVVYTGGAGATYLPGNVGGSTATGGQYT